MILASVKLHKMGQRYTSSLASLVRVEVAKSRADEDNGERLEAKTDLMRFMEGGS